MTSPNLQPTQLSAADALLDQLERDLAALTTASLDEHDAAPAVVVDEFDEDFLAHWALPARAAPGKRLRE